MKLYTEEQVLKAIQEARYYSDLIKPDNVILKELTQIELPSDEEIQDYRASLQQDEQRYENQSK